MSPSASQSGYLLAFDEAGARVLALPWEGQLILSNGCTITLKDGEAILTSVEGEVEVDGQPVVEPWWLGVGAVVRVGAASYIFQRDPRQERTQALSARAFEGRLGVELERAARYERPLSVAVVLGGGVGADSLAVGALRRVDVVGQGRPDELLLLLPEAGHSARIPAGRVVAALGPSARAGVAVYPDDGATLPALLAAARGAAAAAAPGGVVLAGDSATHLHIGARQIVVADPKMRALFEMVRSLASSALPVLVTGETGTGKELVAQALHHWSGRAAGPMVSINCGAMPESLLESELFGVERGAFSGADRSREGLLESACGGTIFLDEVGEASPRTQAELLRVIETRRVRRLGSIEERPATARVVAATNADLARAIDEGRFRQDLYYRLAAVHLVVPPLRERVVEIPPLMRACLTEACAEEGREEMRVAPDAMTCLEGWSWPGNIRELRNLARLMAATIPEGALTAAHLAPALAGRPQSHPPPPRPPAKREGFMPLAEEIRALERQRIEEALAATGGVRVRAAALIDMPLRTFVNKLKVYGFTPQRRRP